MDSTESEDHVRGDLKQQSSYDQEPLSLDGSAIINGSLTPGMPSPAEVEPESQGNTATESQHTEEVAPECGNQEANSSKEGAEANKAEGGGVDEEEEEVQLKMVGQCYDSTPETVLATTENQSQPEVSLPEDVEQVNDTEITTSAALQNSEPVQLVETLTPELPEESAPEVVVQLQQHGDAAAAVELSVPESAAVEPPETVVLLETPSADHVIESANGVPGGKEPGEIQPISEEPSPVAPSVEIVLEEHVDVPVPEVNSEDNTDVDFEPRDASTPLLSAEPATAEQQMSDSYQTAVQQAKDLSTTPETTLPGSSYNPEINALLNKMRKYPAVSVRNFNLLEFAQAVSLLQHKVPMAKVVDLLNILRKPHVKALITTYNDIALADFEISREFLHCQSNGIKLPVIHRILGLYRPGSSTDLGLTLAEFGPNLKVTNVDERSDVSKFGLMHIGDIISEVNGQPVRSLKELELGLKHCPEGSSLKIIPSLPDNEPPAQSYWRACFDYDPRKDEYLPCKDIGLYFRAGDILQVIRNVDVNWWQACKLNHPLHIGIIPTDTLEAKRKQKGAVSYEEVCKQSSVGRRAVILIGAPGVGRRTLKSHLLRHDAVRFGAVVPYTTRKKRQGETNGKEYVFISRTAMEKEIKRGRFIEWGEFNENTYGTSMKSVRDVAETGKVCVLDSSPQVLKHLYNAEFMPFVVFIKPPPIDEQRILQKTWAKPVPEEDMEKTIANSVKLESAFQQYFDLSLVNRNHEETFQRLLEALNKLQTDPQWVPVSWTTSKHGANGALKQKKMQCCF